jgi:hypothetical protein
MRVTSGSGEPPPWRIYRRGKANGELIAATNAKLLVDSIFGPVYYRLLLHLGIPTEQYGNDLIDQALPRGSENQERCQANVAAIQQLSSLSAIGSWPLRIVSRLPNSPASRNQACQSLAYVNFPFLRCPHIWRRSR